MEGEEGGNVQEKNPHTLQTPSSQIKALIKRRSLVDPAVAHSRPPHKRNRGAKTADVRKLPALLFRLPNSC